MEMGSSSIINPVIVIRMFSLNMLKKIILGLYLVHRL